MRFKLFLSIVVIFTFSSVFVSAALDLKFLTTITQSPDPATTGATVTLSASFKSAGGAVTNMKIIGGVDGTQLFERTYASILADKTKTDLFTWTAAAGSHTVWFELDPGHTCGDSNYANNRTEKAVSIGVVGPPPVGQPDLVPEVILTPAKLEEGKGVLLSITVKNIGSAGSAACKGILKEDGVETESKTIPAIEAGGQWKATVFRIVKCNSKYEIFVDTNNLNNESNEGNNSWTKIMRCGYLSKDIRYLYKPLYKEDPNGPDLTVKIVKIYKDPNDLSGKTGFVTFEVENIGKVPSILSTVEVKRGGVPEKIIAITALKVGEKFPGILREEYVCGQQTTMKVDLNNENVESNETNNTAKKTILCLNLSKDVTKYLK